MSDIPQRWHDHMDKLKHCMGMTIAHMATTDLFESTPWARAGLTVLAGIYPQALLCGQGLSKTVWHLNEHTVIKLYYTREGHERELNIYQAVTQHSSTSTLAHTVWRTTHAEQERLKPLKHKADIPRNISQLIADCGAQQFGRNRTNTVKILDWENINLDHSLLTRKTQTEIERYELHCLNLPQPKPLADSGKTQH